MNTLRVVVDGMFRQGSNNLAVSLVAASGETLPSWQPGAHIDLHLANGLIRQYSLTGSCSDPERYLICVARENASRGGSRYVHDNLRPGQELKISAPRNVFPLAEASSVVLVAAGIGITPLYAMAEHLESSGTPFVLHYYAKNRENVAFVRELSRHFRHGHSQLWYSSEGHSPRGHLPQELCSPSAGSRLYLCGPEGFMQHLRERATEQGWPAENIHSEAFAPVAAPAAAADSEEFRVTLTSSGQSFTIPADKTIACVLLENNVSVPLSCEMGMCGACLTPVMEGTVDHRDTVQSEGEKAAPQQQIALCCSRSHSRNLVIEL